MATLSALSRSPSLSTRPISTSTSTSASLTFLTGRRTPSSSVSLTVAAAACSSLLHCSFIPSSTISSSSFSGLSLGFDLSSNNVGVGIRRRGYGLVVRAGKAALCLTKRSRSRKSLARTHGFRRRTRTTSGRAMLKRRRAKGRKVLCTKTNSNNGKRA